MNTLGIALAAAGGALAIVLPAALTPGLPHYDAPLWPALREGIEGASPSTLLLLADVGFVAGWLHPARPRILGAATMLVPPLVAVAEMTVDPTSHNLWPFEFVFYALGTAPGIAGAALGARLRRRRS